MYEEEDVRRPHIPWVIFDELRDDKNYHYGNVETWSRMKARVLGKSIGKVEMPEPSLAGLCREIERSRFGDVLAYLAKKDIVRDAMPYLTSLLHTVPKTHYMRLNAHEKFASSEHTPLYGGGASYISFTEALSKSIGELLERYALLTPFFERTNRVVCRTFGDNRIPRALLCEIPRFFEWQRTYIPNGLTREIIKSDAVNEAVIHCVRGESLSSGESVNIPLQHVTWGPQYKKGTPDADTYTISPRTTSGGGGGFTMVDATLSGLCELIERDGFHIYWLNRLAPLRIRIEPGDSGGFSPRFLEVYRSLSDRGYEVYFLNTTTDIHVPSITCVILARLSDGRKSVGVTGKCHTDPIRAIELALLEHVAFLSSPLSKEATTSVLGPIYVPFANRKIGKKERLRMWREGGMTDEITFFLSGKEISSGEWVREFHSATTGQEDALSRVLGEFARLEKESGTSYEVFRYEVRNPILEDLEYHVVKTVVPALMPLYLGETRAVLDSVRLRDVPNKLGYTAASADAYNPIPHPYP
ncbi:MAG: YcaO-like family protein [bacterium]|nr:YcaO-like family protein [bacterium]